MNEQEIRAKAMEIAVNIKVNSNTPIVGCATTDKNLILGNFLFLAEMIEEYIRNPHSSEPVEK